MIKDICREHRVLRERNLVSVFSVNSVANCLLLFTFYLLLFTSACSIPNLEKPECTEAREAVREFYSFHFGSDMRPSAEYLQKREKYLTSDWKKIISKNLDGKEDYFTLSEDYPKAFRIGACEIVEPNVKVDFGVVLFWKDEARSEQREIKVEMVKTGDKWLINKNF